MSTAYWIGTAIRVVGGLVLLVSVFMHAHWSVGVLLGFVWTVQEIREVIIDLQAKLEELRAEARRRGRIAVPKTP